jgi:ubiquinone/menaquinone biosynthesis C-methylase UbiE
MNVETIQRQYDEIVAPHYDLDPQSVTNRSLDRAVEQIRKEQFFGDGSTRLKVYDVGAGTGLFLMKLIALGGEQIQPFALDLSAQMLANAQRKMPDLAAAVDDGANLDAHFHDELFDLISTHFITGFVPMNVLAAKIWDRLNYGGYWSFMGASKEAYPALQAKANSKFLRWWTGTGGNLAIEDYVTIPCGREEVVKTLESHGFEICAVETFKPVLTFRNFDDFMDFGYRGGWLTPFIEGLGLHKAGFLTRWILNTFFFPINDHHTIEIALAQKGKK